MERINQLNKLATRYAWRDWVWSRREDIMAIGCGSVIITAFWLTYCLMA